MDKQTLSNYGWIVICVMVLAVMIALASPFGSYIKDAVSNTTEGLFGVNQNALSAAGIAIEDNALGVKMLDGNNQSYLQGYADALSFRSSAEMKDFEAVEVDGEIVDASNYVVTEGSTIITFLAEYLNKLPVGTHTVTIVSSTGTATATFVVENKYDAVFANNTWDQIIEACENNAIPSTWNVGDTKVMTINGTDYNIAIIGKYHDTYANGGKAPLTLQTVELVGQYKIHTEKTSTCGWSESYMRNTVMPQVLETMPTNIQNAIKTVNKSTNKGGITEVTQDKLFLLACAEIDSSMGTAYGTELYAAEGSQYEYYRIEGSNYNKETSVKKLPNATLGTGWWCRTPLNGGDGFVCVNQSGWPNRNYSEFSTTSRGVAPAFCF